MKHIDYVYFNIYSYFYRISQERHHINPRIQAMYLFSLGSGGWILMLEAIYLHLIKRSWFPSPAESMTFAVSLYLLIAIFFNYVFIVKDRDQKIINRYEDAFTQNPRKNLHFILSIGVLVIPYLALAFSAIYFRRYSQ
jgi:hypothetical protein